MPLDIDEDLFLTSTCISNELEAVAKKLDIEVPVEFDRGDVAETAVHLYVELGDVGELLQSADELSSCNNLTAGMRTQLIERMRRLARELMGAASMLAK